MDSSVKIGCFLNYVKFDKNDLIVVIAQKILVLSQNGV